MRRAAALACVGIVGFGCTYAGPWLRAAAANVVTVVQSHRAFNVSELRIKRGDTVDFSNDDSFNHQVFVKSPSFSFESAEQAPGQTIGVKFPTAGTFDVQCGIHPRMHLAVTVE